MITQSLGLGYGLSPNLGVDTDTGIYPVYQYIVTEDDDNLVTEDGEKFITQQSVPLAYILTQDNDNFTTEDSDKFITI